MALVVHRDYYGKSEGLIWKWDVRNHDGGRISEGLSRSWQQARKDAQRAMVEWLYDN